MNYPINLSFDTNIFDSQNYNFIEGTDFHTLIKYISEGYINVILSNIVVEEMKSHCVNKAMKVYDNINNCIEIGKQLNLSNIPSLPSKEKLEHESQEFINDFIIKLNASVMDYNNISIEELFNSYFKRIPPFEDKKKEEFPDAVIAAQIKNCFNIDNPIFVVTQDKGLKKALVNVSYCSICTSLKEIFDHISKLKAEYSNIVKIIEHLLPEVIQKMQYAIEKEPDNYITFNGLDYDRKGIIGGFEYEDISYSSIKVDNASIFSLDYYNQEKISATLRCCVTVNATCSYDDYDHAIWDSEEKDYFFLDTITNYEYHKAHFACSVEINRNTEEISSLKFHIYLGGDSRISRYKESDFSQPYAICPDCGKEISHLNDGGNGFCVDCAPNH